MSNNSIGDFHWMVTMFNNIDVGMVVIDSEYNILSWNGFMVHHSNIDASDAKDKNLFDLFPSIDKPWLIKKIDTVKTIENQAFITWEQKPHLFPFENYRPITSTVEFMYQNITIIPLPSLTGKIDKISLIIYDVTDAAANRLELQSLRAQKSS